MVEPGGSSGPPRGTSLVHVEESGSLAERFQAEHRGLGGAGPVDLALQLAGVDLGAVSAGQQAADFVGRAVDLRAALRRGTVEEVDEAPGELLGIALEGGLG